jgi:serine/threonine protein kinase
MGTPYHMAPEQSRDAHSVDARADLYATLFHMFYGQIPYEGSDFMHVLVRAATQPLVFPKSTNVSVKPANSSPR